MQIHKIRQRKTAIDGTAVANAITSVFDSLIDAELSPDEGAVGDGVLVDCEVEGEDDEVDVAVADVVADAVDVGVADVVAVANEDVVPVAEEDAEDVAVGDGVTVGTDPTTLQ